MDAHAQQEIRDYSATIGEKIVKPLFPVVWEAFEDYRLGGLFLSRVEIAVMQKLVARPKTGNVWTVEDFMSVQDDTWKSLARSRERDECRSKLEQLGLLAPLSSPGV
jgi:thymidylate synthase (FAD)